MNLTNTVTVINFKMIVPRFAIAQQILKITCQNIMCQIKKIRYLFMVHISTTIYKVLSNVGTSLICVIVNLWKDFSQECGEGI